MEATENVHSLRPYSPHIFCFMFLIFYLCQVVQEGADHCVSRIPNKIFYIFIPTHHTAITNHTIFSNKFSSHDECFISSVHKLLTYSHFLLHPANFHFTTQPNIICPFLLLQSCPINYNQIIMHMHTN